MATSCSVSKDPYGRSSISRADTCQTDLTLPVELERSKFLPPEIWTRFSQCEFVYTSRDLGEDAWGISVASNYTYADVLVHDTAIGFGVIGNLDMIGDFPITLEGWREFEDKKWQKYINSKGESEKRVVVYESRNNLDCWRETILSYNQGEQSALSIAYHCWQPGKESNPPIDIGGWIRYRDGKPVYDLDIDKDLIDPVFDTLQVKDIKPEVYAERMAIYNEKMKEDCEWRKKDLRKNRFRAFNDYEIKRLEECGYDTTKLKREEE